MSGNLKYLENICLIMKINNGVGVSWGICLTYGTIQSIEEDGIQSNKLYIKWYYSRENPQGACLTHQSVRAQLRNFDAWGWGGGVIR